MTRSLAASRRRRPSRTAAFRIPLVFTVWAERRALSRLTDRQLRDIAVSRQDARAEAARPFWDLPRWRS